MGRWLRKSQTQRILLEESTAETRSIFYFPWGCRPMAQPRAAPQTNAYPGSLSYHKVVSLVSCIPSRSFVGSTGHPSEMLPQLRGPLEEGETCRGSVCPLAGIRSEQCGTPNTTLMFSLTFLPVYQSEGCNPSKRCPGNEGTGKKGRIKKG